jgi:hypothetical protein
VESPTAETTEEDEMSDVTAVKFSNEIPVSLDGADLETALMLVQHARVKLLDDQLATQMKEVDARNKKIAQLNDVLTGLNQVSVLFPADAKPDSIPCPGEWDREKQNTVEIPLNDAIRAAGITDLGFSPNQCKAQITGQVIPSGANAFNGSVPKSEVDAAITKVKGMIDGLSNTQQLDMLRLQSMTGKRNEAYDIMTNISKKLQDNRNSIIGNLR